MKFCTDGFLRSDNLITESIGDKNLVVLQSSKYIFVEDAELSTGNLKVFTVCGPQLKCESNYINFTNLICRLYVGAGTNKKIVVEEIDEPKDLRILTTTFVDSVMHNAKDCPILFIYILDDSYSYSSYGLYRPNDHKKMIAQIETFTATKKSNKKSKYDMYMDYYFALPIYLKDNFSEDEDEFDVFMQLMQVCGVDYDNAMAHDNIRFAVKFIEAEKCTCEVTCKMTLENNNIVIQTTDLFSSMVRTNSADPRKGENWLKILDAEKVNSHTNDIDTSAKIILIRILSVAHCNEQVFTELDWTISHLAQSSVFISDTFISWDGDTNSIRKETLPQGDFGKIYIDSPIRLKSYHCNGKVELITFIPDIYRHEADELSVFETPSDEIIMDIVTALMEG